VKLSLFNRYCDLNISSMLQSISTHSTQTLLVKSENCDIKGILNPNF